MPNNGKFSHVVAIGALGGFLFGCHIGYAGVATQLLTYAADCNNYQSDQACSSTPICYWSRGSCWFKDQPANVTCRAFANSTTCGAMALCEWFNVGDEKCLHSNPWTPSDQGVFSGMMIVGAMFGSLPAGELIDRFGRRRTIILAAILGVLSAGLFFAGWHLNDDGEITTFSLVVVGRFIAGLSVGITSVASPMYVGEASPEEHIGLTGCLFQIFCTFGIFLMAAVGLVIHRAADGFRTVSNATELVQIENGVLLVAAVLYFVAGLVVDEPSADPRSLSLLIQPGSMPQRPSDNEMAPMMAPPSEGSLWKRFTAVPWWSLRIHLLSAVLLSAVQQLTGINAIMNYAPALSGNFGLEPLTGNACIMFWNFITTVASIRLTKNFSVGQVFIGGGVVASVACFITAIPTLPLVSPEGNWGGMICSAIGIAVFIAAFEMGMGPFFYVLAQSLFPASWRSQGCSFTLVTQFVFNVIINWGYPVLVSAFSGGKRGNQRLGTAVMFFVFGAIGLVCTLALWSVTRSRPRH